MYIIDKMSRSSRYTFGRPVDGKDIQALTRQQLDLNGLNNDALDNEVHLVRYTVGV